MKAFITGIAGQDGAYLSEYLLGRGYEVHGCDFGSQPNLWRLKELGIEEDIHLHVLDLSDEEALHSLLKEQKFDELYHLAAQSFVADSFKNPAEAIIQNGAGVARIWQSVRDVSPNTRFFQASTSELFGKAKKAPQTEETPFYPVTPYGVAKMAGHWSVVNAREAFGLHACNGILYNHESPLRGPLFVTRKITASLSRLAEGAKEPLALGNLEAKRDWSFAGDIVRGMHAMLQQETPDDYILASGQTHSVRDFVQKTAACFDFDLVWEGEAAEEIGRDEKSGRILVRINPEFYRPIEPGLLCGSVEKAAKKLGWKPEVSFEGLIEKMAKADRARAKAGKL